MEGDPRLVAAKKLRLKGRNETAVQMLSDLLLAATEGRSDGEQMGLELAPLYYEYGCALASAVRSAQDTSQESRVPKKLRRDDDGEEDSDLAWKLLDQARCIYEGAVDDETTKDQDRKRCRSELARCCMQLGLLNADAKQWGDAIVEYISCIEQYEARGPPYSLDEDKRLVASLVGAATAYVRAADGTDVVVGDGILVAPADECLDRAATLVGEAEKRLNTLLTAQATEKAEHSKEVKLDICSLSIELQAAKDILVHAQANGTAVVSNAAT